MSGPVKLQYHQETFDLLDEEPVLSADALKQIGRCEQQCGNTLPASVREWYSLEGAEDRLTVAVDDGEMRFTPLAVLLKAFASWWAPRRKRGAKRVFVICNVGSTGRGSRLILNGQRDPPVTDFPEELTRRPFSCFVRERALDRLTAPRALACYLHEGVAGPAQIDYLLEHFREARRNGPSPSRDPRTGEPFMVWACRFYSRTAVIHITARGDPTREEGVASWDISADSTEELYDLLKRLWPFLGDTERLVSRDSPWEDLVEEVLARLRAGFGNPTCEPGAQKGKR
ncbi:MAG: hypothetical protein L0Z62_09910 [Gemmataceae bacterium]|nr:hypothetical protein [Gemmataceae bacterium]